MSTPGLIPRFSIFPDRIPVAFFSLVEIRSRSAFARVVEACTSFLVHPEGPDSGRRVSSSAVSDPSMGARAGAHQKGRFMCSAWAP